MSSGNERSYRPPPPERPLSADEMAQLRARALAKIHDFRTDVLMAPVPMPTMWRALAYVDAAAELVGSDPYTTTTRNEAVSQAEAAVRWIWCEARRLTAPRELPVVLPPTVWAGGSVN